MDLKDETSVPAAGTAETLVFVRVWMIIDENCKTFLQKYADSITKSSSVCYNENKLLVIKA